jgi:hypothetical protein
MGGSALDPSLIESILYIAMFYTPGIFSLAFGKSMHRMSSSIPKPKQGLAGACWQWLAATRRAGGGRGIAEEDRGAANGWQDERCRLDERYGQDLGDDIQIMQKSCKKRRRKYSSNLG